MYEISLILQYIGILILIIEIFFIVQQNPSKPQSLLLVFTITTLVNLIGYLFEMTSVNKDMAIIGVKIAYCGKIYLTLTMFLFVMEYCKVKLPALVSNTLFVIHTMIFLLVLTCDRHTLYYSNIDYTQDGLFPHLVLGHGIMYYIYMIFLVFYMISIPCVCYYRYRNLHNQIERKSLLYLMLMTFVTVFGYMAFLTGWTDGYDTTAIAYVISAVLLLFVILRYNLFDTLTLAKDYAIDNQTDGLIVFSHSNELLYCNSPAKKLYPELESGEYAKVVKDMDLKSNLETYIYHENAVYEVFSREIVQNQISYGKMYVINDITDNYNYTQRLEEDVHKKTKEIAHIERSVIASFANMVEARDGVTGLHIKRTSAYVEIIAKGLRKHPDYKDGLSDQYMDTIIEAAPLHDIGKISIPDAILTKPGRLTDEEFEIIKTHTTIGAHIINDILSQVGENQYLSVAKDMAYYHHEKWNGSGYPCGLKGEEIPLSARIMAIADVYDALCSKRSYKEGFSKEKALEIIKEGKGQHFDPLIVDVFVANIEQIEQI